MQRTQQNSVSLLVGLACVIACSAASAAESQYKVEPSTIQLHGHRARQQLLVSEAFPNGQQADVTGKATFETRTPAIALVTSTGLVIPRGHGKAEIVVRLGDFTQIIFAEVVGLGHADPIDFNTDVIAAISRAGCNQGACHGSPQGKGGFRLSLRGFDPALDLVTLVREDFNRRTNPMSPDESLILKKGLAELPHQGGRRFNKNDASYQILRAWIEEGCQPSKTPQKLTRLEVLPGNRRLPEAFPQQRLIALAHFDDGTVRDVTDLCVFTSGDDDAASISPSGLIEFRRTSEVAFLVRYLSAITGARLSYVKRDPQFAFRAPPEVNVVDTFVFAKQRELQLVPAPVASDEVFLRRVSLDVTGMLPTADETQRFLDSTDANKRAKLIDELLSREEYAEFWALKWADVMRGSDVTISRRGVHSFHRYLLQLVREDRPLDQFARETLTALGNTVNVPAANFYRIARTPDEAAEATAQLFLGVRIGCAKCHNHPFEAITQDDYYGLAAYFARVRFKGKQFMVDDETVFLERSGDVRHPTRNVVVPPAAFGQSAGKLTADDDPRERLADWLTKSDNRWFAPSIVNRLWFHLFGRGIVHPVDDFRDTNPPSNPELLQSLAAEFAAQGYRVKPVLRLILNSSTYQLQAGKFEQSPLAAKPEAYFTQAVPRMLSAEQVLDAVAAVTGVSEEFPGYPAGTRAIALAEGAIDHPLLKAFSKPVRDATCECAREEDPSLSQVIHLLNNPAILGHIKSPEGRIQKWLSAKLSDDEIVTQIFLTTLTRRPTADELKLARQHIAAVGSRPDALFDLQHALLNSNEFLLRH